MSRPRPPLHDPYGLLRPPPPLETSSFYSASTSNLGSTVSLPLPSASPGRRPRRASPSRTQQGEEYDDQPYLTNVVRHHGQVTLVPPVNQGRTRKIRRRRNPDAALSSVSLLEPGPRPVSVAGPSDPVQPRSPRRPRHGSDTRAVSSPDVHAVSYPDYPPPSFEEVLALDRRAAVSDGLDQPTAEEGVQPDPQSSPFALPVVSSDPQPVATPWEEDRRLGLTLEERVRRELERNAKSDAPPSSSKITIDTTNLPDDVLPPPSSGTPTSIAASNFLTPQNLTPSPLGIPLPLSSHTSPQVALSEPRSPSPPVVLPKSPAIPPKSPVISLPPTPGASQPIQTTDSVPNVARSHLSNTLDKLAQTSSTRTWSHGEQPATPRPTARTISQGSPPKAPTPLSSLLFTTKLVLEPRTSTEHIADSNTSLAGSSKGKLKETTSESPSLETVETPRALSPRKPWVKSRPLSEIAASSSSIDSFQPLLPRRPRSPVKSEAEPTPISPNLPRIPPAPPTISTLRKPPPPPPPLRPRPQSMGTGVAARISAYESILANAPKVPPPIPPRPRVQRKPSVPPLREPEEDAHIGDRPTSVLVPDPGLFASTSRPLPVPPIRPTSLVRLSSPERTRRDPSPDRSNVAHPQALVPARIGPDGKLEMIPDADVIWLDEKEQAKDRGRSGSVLEERDYDSVEGPSTQRGIISSPPSPVASEIPLSPVPNLPDVLSPALSTTTPRSVSSPRLADDFEYTDLDLLISRLEENEAARQGADYEQLLTVGEVLGPANPSTRPELDLNVGLIEIERRRVMKDGRVKLKLSLMGVSVDKCKVCLAQFKNNESAVLLPCLHSYHKNCIMSWLVRQDTPTCPYCRAPV